MNQITRLHPNTPSPEERRPRVLVLLNDVASIPPTITTDRRGAYDIRLTPVWGLSGIPRGEAAVLGLDAIAIEVDPASPPELAQFERVAQEHAGRIPTLAILHQPTVNAIRRVLEAGAAGVLSLPFSETELAAALEPARCQANKARSAPAAVSRGKTVSFLGARGGCGVTSVVTQLAILWAAKARVCLIDLDVQLGNAGLYLDVDPEFSLVDVLEARRRLDAEVLSSLVERHPSGLHVITAPRDVAPLDTVTVEGVEALLSLAARVYDIVLIDLPAACTDSSMQAMAMSDLTILVAPLNGPGLHQAKRQLEMLDSNGLGDRIQVAGNRVRRTLLGRLELREPQSLLGRRIDHVIADDPKAMGAATRLGKPMSKATSGSRAEKDLRTMLANLMAGLGPSPAT